jgi:hypothetical protein
MNQLNPLQSEIPIRDDITEVRNIMEGREL